MPTWLSPATVALVAFVVVLLGVIVLFNVLVRARTHVDRAWAQVDVQLQRRHDLIPALVEVTRGAAGHERALLDAVVHARSAALQQTDPSARLEAEDRLSVALGALLAVDERLPALRSDAVFLDLQAHLRDTEDRIAFARGFANDRVARYRTRTDTVPGIWLATLLRFPRDGRYVRAVPTARTTPAVQLQEDR